MRSGSRSSDKAAPVTCSTLSNPTVARDDEAGWLQAPVPQRMVRDGRRPRDLPSGSFSGQAASRRPGLSGRAGLPAGRHGGARRVQHLPGLQGPARRVAGSYDLLKKLLLEVWAHGDEELYRWVLEWFYDILAHPGRKCGTSIAIRGEYGDGKSIVTEQCMSTILGETQGGMLLRVADQNAVLGDFNELMLCKLLVVLEEAAFSGNKQAFDRLQGLGDGRDSLDQPEEQGAVHHREPQQDAGGLQPRPLHAREAERPALHHPGEHWRVAG